MSTDHRYNYPVTNVARVIDGDTFDFDVDLGFHAILRIRVRLADIDTYEVYGKNAHQKGPLAREAAANWMTAAHLRGALAVRTYKLNTSTPISDGAFGRWLGEVYDTDNGNLLADYLRDEGFDKNQETSDV